MIGRILKVKIRVLHVVIQELESLKFLQTRWKLALDLRSKTSFGELVDFYQRLNVLISDSYTFSITLNYKKAYIPSSFRTIFSTTSWINYSCSEYIRPGHFFHSLGSHSAFISAQNHCRCS